MQVSVVENVPVHMGETGRHQITEAQKWLFFPLYPAARGTITFLLTTHPLENIISKLKGQTLPPEENSFLVYNIFEYFSHVLLLSDSLVLR